eukprot:TRINITY_DN23860_c0_g2_i1.p1 TRINITY_DN23860_c0_g2~~TRINITY_DN23860_c0_g2_i1.p1  ORF type:complete len:262 (+),score=54.23 TRINITY_DN23860_c0_g2_i1:162-947(+)
MWNTWRLSVWLCIFALSVQHSWAALPPGWDDELFCPSNHCLREKRNLPLDFEGSRSLFFECAERGDERSSTQPPIPWGENYGQDAKQRLLAAGYHSESCSANEGATGEEPSDLHESAGRDDLKASEEAPDMHVQAEVTSGLKQDVDGEVASSSSFPIPPVLVAGALVAIIAVARYGSGTSRGKPPTLEQKASMEAARQQRLDKLYKEAEEFRTTDEWRAKEKAAQSEATCTITPEQRRAAAGQGRCGSNFQGSSPGSIRSR